jgi:Zn-dependent protease with chaperone function
MVMAYRGRYDREIIPCTYRSHLVVLSHQEERKLADSAFIEEKAKFEMVDPSDPRSVRVRLIVERIVHAAHRGLGIYDSNDAPMLRVTEKRRPKWGKAQPHTDHLRGLNWEVFLAKDDYRDARITPSGKIIVSTGLLDQSTSDEEIAAVLAHEVAMLCFH